MPFSDFTYIIKIQNNIVLYNFFRSIFIFLNSEICYNTNIVFSLKELYSS